MGEKSGRREGGAEKPWTENTKRAGERMPSDVSVGMRISRSASISPSRPRLPETLHLSAPGLPATFVRRRCPQSLSHYEEEPHEFRISEVLDHFRTESPSRMHCKRAPNAIYPVPAYSTASRYPSPLPTLCTPTSGRIALASSSGMTSLPPWESKRRTVRKALRETMPNRPIPWTREQKEGRNGGKEKEKEKTGEKGKGEGEAPHIYN